MKKKVILIILIVLLATVCAAIALARTSQPPVPMGMKVTTPGKVATMLADLRSSFTTGKDELQHSLDAKKSAKSFRMKTSLQLHPGQPLETLVEVSCPDRERFTTTIGERAYHAVRIGDKRTWSRRTEHGPRRIRLRQAGRLAEIIPANPLHGP